MHAHTSLVASAIILFSTSCIVFSPTPTGMVARGLVAIIISMITSTPFEYDQIIAFHW